MLRKALVAACFAAFAAGAVPAFALNPQPLPPGPPPCECNLVTNYKRYAYLRYVLKQYYFKQQLLNRYALTVR